jgi:hypothetical protein
MCWSDERVRHCVEKTEKMGHKLEAISASLNTVRHADQPRTESTSWRGVEPEVVRTFTVQVYIGMLEKCVD